MTKKPNIVMIMGDDIGITNLSCYSDGLLGYKTPNIDRIAKEGMKFTDFYGEQSCTAGRAAFCTGQSPFRSGLSKVGLPGAKQGILPGTPTIAWALKEQGYRTGQFGKNHFGDRPEHYPTAHGFDEFYGVFYHLNAYEEPYNRGYPQDKEFRDKYGPRNLTHTWADGREEDHGPLDPERMKTVDDEFWQASKKFINEAVEADEPFFLWHNTTHMHYYTHTKDGSVGQSNGDGAGLDQSVYHDTMIDHDKNVGEILDELDRLGIADNTIVVYTTDNGPHMNMWPDAAMTPFRNEKNTNWEGGFRVPCVARYPAKWQKGETLNGIVSLMDWFTTFVSEAGNPKIREQMKKGGTFGGEKLKAWIDGEDLSDYLAGKTEDSPRDSFIYMSDDGDVLGVRYRNFKCHFMVQEMPGTMGVWEHPFTPLRAPLIFNLRLDPFERAHETSNTYWEWVSRNEWVIVPIQGLVGEAVATFKDFPPLQKPGSFSLKDVVAKLQQPQIN